MKLRANISAVGLWFLLWAAWIEVKVDQWLDRWVDAWRRCGIITGPGSRARQERMTDDV